MRRKSGIVATCIVISVFFNTLSFADTVDDLIKDLSSSDPMVRCTAAEQLGQLKDKRAVEPLIALLLSDDSASSPSSPAASIATDPVAQKVEQAKRAVAGGNQHTQPSSTVDTATLKKLIADLRSANNPIEKANAAEALGKTGDRRAISTLLPLLSEKDFGQLHAKVIAALGEIGDPKPVPQLIQILRSNDVFSAKAAAAALAKIGDPSAAEPLYQALTTNVFLRNDAADALATLGGAESIMYLNNAAKHQEKLTQRAADRALDSLGPEHGLAPLTALLKDPDNKVRSLAAQALAQIGDPIVQVELDHAAETLDESSKNAIRNQTNLAPTAYTSSLQVNVKICVMESLALIGDPRAVRPLLAALQDQDENICRAAGRALASWKSKAILRPIEMSLNSQDRAVVKQAIRDFGWIGTKDAITRIAAFLDNPFYRSEAVVALGNSGSPDALPFLDQQILNPFLQDEVVEAVAKIDHPDSITLFTKALSSNNFVVRNKAVEALEKSNDPAIIDPLTAAIEKGNPQTQKKIIDILNQFQDPRIDRAFFNLLTDPFVGQKALALLKERKWQPTTTTEKVCFYVADGQWDKCAALGVEAVDPLIAELKKNSSPGAAKALGIIGEKRAYAPLLECVKQWRAAPEHIEALEKMGYKPATIEEQFQVAVLRQDRDALMRFWKESNGRNLCLSLLNSDNVNAMYQIAQVSIFLKLNDMISPMISRLNSLSDKDAALQLANIFLSSHNKTLYQAGKDWVIANGGKVIEFPTSAPAW